LPTHTRSAALLITLLLALLNAPSARAGVLLSDNFDSYTLTTHWAEGSSYGNWLDQFNGFGTTQVVTSTNPRLQEKPKASTSASETHGALVTSTQSFPDFDASLKMKTVSQLRTGSAPNPWEMAWALWHYQSGNAFYYLILKTTGWEVGKEYVNTSGLQDQCFLSTGSAPTFALNTFYTIRIKQVANAITVWVNGSQLTSFTDASSCGVSPYTSGSLGLYTEDAQVQFDDVTVSSVP
jgi:hypothetical protein